MNNFVKDVLNNGGDITPLIIPSNMTNGTGTFNPSIYNDNGRLLMNMRHCQVTIYHSEKGKFEHEWGPLCYLNPENDITLTTTNYFCELDPVDLSIKWFRKVDFSLFDKKPLWEFIGLEDCRVVRWQGKLYICGVRRDTTTNGQGRMELCEIMLDGDVVKEISRFRIPVPNGDVSYCEKNWMPILDKPYHFVKWCSPVDIVKVNPETKDSETAIMGKIATQFGKDQRGGSQVIPIGDNGDHFCITHEVDLFKSENGHKDAIYRHKFIKFDKNWEVSGYSDSFSFMNASIEFCAGICKFGNDYLITFGVTDNAAYILRCPANVIEGVLNGKN